MPDESLLTFIRARLPAPSDRDRLEAIAAGSGVPFHTLLKIASGETADPRISTVQSLYDYLKAIEERAAA